MYTDVHTDHQQNTYRGLGEPFHKKLMVLKDFKLRHSSSIFKTSLYVYPQCNSIYIYNFRAFFMLSIVKYSLLEILDQLLEQNCTNMNYSWRLLDITGQYDQYCVNPEKVLGRS